MKSGYRICSQFNLSWAVFFSKEDRVYFNRGDDGYPSGIMDTYFFESFFSEPLRWVQLCYRFCKSNQSWVGFCFSEVKRHGRCTFKWYNRLGKKLEVSFVLPNRSIELIYWLALKPEWLLRGVHKRCGPIRGGHSFPTDGVITIMIIINDYCSFSHSHFWLIVILSFLGPFYRKWFGWLFASDCKQQFRNLPGDWVKRTTVEQHELAKAFWFARSFNAFAGLVLGHQSLLFLGSVLIGTDNQEMLHHSE